MTDYETAVQRLRAASNRHSRAIQELDNAEKELTEAALALDLLDGINQQKPIGD
jgi:hypothetical protein